MTFNSIGDLAQGFALRSQNTILKQQMDRLTQELASGKTADVSQHLSGDFMSLSDIEHKLVLSQSYRRGADQARIETEIMQIALDSVQREAESLGLIGVTVGASPGALDISSFANDARNTVEAIFSALNSSIGGRALFSGDVVDSIPLKPPSDFVAAIQGAAAGSLSISDLSHSLDAFFDTGGGFETLIYQGGEVARGAYQLGEGESVKLDFRADHPAIRDVLKQVAILTVLDDPGVVLTVSEKVDIAAQAGETLLGAQSRITGIRGDLGFAESRIDRASSRLSAEHASLSLIQADLLAVDPYDTATDLETVQLRLETLYTITSRTSRLNLVNFL